MKDFEPKKTQESMSNDTNNNKYFEPTSMYDIAVPGAEVFRKNSWKRKARNRKRGRVVPSNIPRLSYEW